jgi:predicted DNA repair protein MutK
MPVANLFAFIKNIATILGNVAISCKVTAKKSPHNRKLLNSKCRKSIRCESRISVTVWVVAKGYFISKVILVPSASELILSYRLR